ncbi:hypothetical protein WDU94_009564 [Cyamophila willieti]
MTPKEESKEHAEEVKNTSDIEESSCSNVSPLNLSVNYSSSNVSLKHPFNVPYDPMVS